MIKSNDKAVFSAINRGKNITIFFTVKIQQKQSMQGLQIKGFIQA
jgi:hypothetical protein